MLENFEQKCQKLYYIFNILYEYIFVKIHLYGVDTCTIVKVPRKNKTIVKKKVVLLKNRSQNGPNLF